jgi:hypothetical protein
MKWFLLSLIIVYSCSSNSSDSLAVDQQGLFELSKNFETDYKEAGDTISRENVISNYELKLRQYLTYTCDSSLKAIKVRMTKLQEDPSGRIYAEFRDQNCSFIFHQVYDSSKQMREDIIYHLVKSLEPGKELSLRLLYGGKVKVNDPLNPSHCNFEIWVIPTAITAG